MAERTDNQSFSLLAVGHYGAEHVRVDVVLQSTRPEKQLLELTYIEAFIKEKVDALREEIRARVQYTKTADIMFVAPLAPETPGG